MPQYYMTSKDMLGMPRKHSLSMGEELLKGNMVVDPWVKVAIPFSIETFDWNAPQCCFANYVPTLSPGANVSCIFGWNLCTDKKDKHI